MSLNNGSFKTASKLQENVLFSKMWLAGMGSCGEEEEELMHRPESNAACPISLPWVTQLEFLCNL